MAASNQGTTAEGRKRHLLFLRKKEVCYPTLSALQGNTSWRLSLMS